VRPYIYPTDEEIERTEVRGIYLSNFVDWNAKEHAELMIREWGFNTVTYRRDRTFNLYAKLDDHANDVHDYLKYLKFGYGRATDDASMEIRHGRLSREEGLQLVKEYDATEPSSLGQYCEFLGISGKQFYDLVEKMRDPKIWRKVHSEWEPIDAVWKHAIGDAENKQRPKLVEDRTFAEVNRRLYYNPRNPPPKTGDPAMDIAPKRFKVL
jgi:hypothetical protein